MLRLLLTFAPVAIVLTITPGVATALVVRHAALEGRRAALSTTVGRVDSSQALARYLP